jgi:hypothetical protein
MSCAIRKYVLAAGAATLLSTQAVAAAPATSHASVDPLVTLSALGTAQSRAAVCAAGTAAAAAGAAYAATQAGQQGCLLPITAPQTAAPVGSSVTPVATTPGKRIGILPIALGLLGLAIVLFLILDDDDNDGGLEPVSPA